MQPGLGEHQVHVIGAGGKATIQGGHRRLRVIAGQLQPRQRQGCAAGPGIVFKNGRQPGDRAIGIAGGGAGHGQHHQDLLVVGLFPGQFLRQFQRGLGFAGRQVGADQRQFRAQPGIFGLRQVLQVIQRRILPLLAVQPGQFQLFGHGDGLRIRDVAQPCDHALGARQVGHGQIDLPQKAKQLDVLRILFQRGQQRIFGRAIAAFGKQHFGDAQAGQGGIARCLGGLRQEIAGQIGLAGAFIGAAHQGQGLGILGVLIQRIAQRGDRGIGVVGIDIPGGTQFQRAGFRGVLCQHLVGQGAGLGLVAGLQQHPRQLNLDAGGLFAGFGTVQNLAQFGDGGLGVSLLEGKARAQHAEDHRIAALFQRGVDFFDGGVDAALHLDKADQVGARRRIVGGRVLGQIAQVTLGLFGLALRHVEAQQIGLGLIVLGEHLDRLQKMRLDGGHVLLLNQIGQALAIADRVVGLQFDQRVDQRLGLGHVVLAPGAVQQDIQQDHVIGAGFRQFGGLGRDGGQLFVILARLLIAAGQIQRLHLGAVGRQFDGAGGVTQELVPVLGPEGHPRQGDPRVQIVGILFGQPQILTIGVTAPILRDQRFGQRLAGLVMGALDIKDIAELDHRAIDIALFQQFQTRLVIFIGLFSRGLAAGKRQPQRQGHGGGQQQTARPAALGCGSDQGIRGHIGHNHS